MRMKATRTRNSNRKDPAYSSCSKPKREPNADPFCLYREMAVGNTFGATALSSYGGFWISFAIILTPGGFQIVETLEGPGMAHPWEFYDSFGLYLIVSLP